MKFLQQHWYIFVVPILICLVCVVIVGIEKDASEWFHKSIRELEIGDILLILALYALLNKKSKQ